MKKKELLKFVIDIICLFPLIGENIISIMFGDTFSKILSMLSCFLILALIIKKGKVNLNFFTIILILLILLRLVIIFVFPSNNIIFVNNIIAPYGLIGYLMLFLFIELNCDDKENLRLLFKSATFIMTISVFLNLFITGDLKIANNVQVFKEAISTGYTNSRKWLFGHRNMIFIHHLMWILFSYVLYKIENKKFDKTFFLEILFTVLVGVISWNSTMMLTAVLLMIIYFLKNKMKIISIFHYLSLYFILEFGIVFFRIQEVFSYIIVDLLHRNLSFTGRTSIWDYYINQFEMGSFINKLFGNFGFTDLSVNSHNMFLGLLAFTGIIGVSLYIVLIIISAKRLYKYRKTEFAKVISMIIFGFLLNALTMEFYLQPLLALYIGYRIDKYIKFLE